MTTTSERALLMGVTLQEEVECSCYGQRAKDDKESQLHDGP